MDYINKKVALTRQRRHCAEPFGQTFRPGKTWTQRESQCTCTGHVVFIFSIFKGHCCQVIESTAKEKLKCGRRKSEAAEEKVDRIWHDFTKSHREVAESYFTVL